MKKSILKTVFGICVVFTLGSVSLQDSTGTKPVVGKAVSLDSMQADIIPPILLPKRPVNSAFVTPVGVIQVKS